MPPEKFSKALYDFDAFLDVEKNLSPKTRRAYQYDLERFADHWIKTHGDKATLDKVSVEDIRRYLEHLRMNLNYRSTTLSRTISSIRIFFEFCVMRGFLKNSPAAHIHNPKTPKKLPIYLVENELKSLLNAPGKSRTTPPVLETLPPLDAPPYPSEENATEPSAAPLPPVSRETAIRDYCILILFAFTGLRLSELVGLNCRDLDFERKTVRVLGKGSKERIIPLNETVVRALKTWLQVRPETPSDEPCLFTNRSNKRFSGRGIEYLVKRYVDKSNIYKDKISPHKLRHTFATLLHVSGVDIIEIQALMGHATITSTQIYTHSNAVKLKDAVRKLDGLE